MAVLQDFCLARGAPNVLAVWGDSGCGKSAAISQFISEHLVPSIGAGGGSIKANASSSRAIQIACFHVVGCSHDSNDLQAMMLRLCHEVCIIHSRWI
jgi:ABC-type transport system involved in cytochrome bd biosynthesis fused ATPase/permease subunit